jgi:hypothetical protein
VEEEQGSAYRLTNPFFGRWMDLQPDNTKRLLWRKPHHVREVGIQRHEDAAVFDGEA